MKCAVIDAVIYQSMVQLGWSVSLVHVVMYKHHSAEPGSILTEGRLHFDEINLCLLPINKQYKIIISQHYVHDIVRV